MLPRWFLGILGSLASVPVRKIEKFEKITKNHDFSLEKITDFHQKIDLKTSISGLILTKLIPRDFCGDNFSGGWEKHEKPPKIDQLLLFCPLEISWFCCFSKFYISKLKNYFSTKLQLWRLLVMKYHHHEGYLCISPSLVRMDLQSWAFSWFSLECSYYVPQQIYNYD